MLESNLPDPKILLENNISCVKKTKELKKEVKEIITYYGISIFLFRPYKPRFLIALFSCNKRQHHTTSNQQQMYQYYFYSSLPVYLMIGEAITLMMMIK